MRLVAFGIAGLAWGIVALLLGGRAMGGAIVGGLVASPFIGMIVGAYLHRFFLSDALWKRALVALASVYVGAMLFGLAVGVYDWVGARPALGLAVVGQAMVGVFYGTTLFLIALWPLAYVTHLALASEVRWWRRP